MSMSKWHLISPSLEYVTLTNRKLFVVLKSLSLEGGERDSTKYAYLFKGIANDRFEFELRMP